MEIKLSKPITVDGKDADTITLKLDELTGKDVDFCVREAAATKGEIVRVLAIDLEFHIQIASKASGVPVEALKKLPASDYVEVATAVQSFLTGSG
jgi:hypothetical protein